MKLSNVEMVPGIVCDAGDPDCLGRVKANAPGLFNSDDPSTLPWIYPLTSSGTVFKVLKEGSRIWILNNISNYMEFWYIPFFELSDVAKDILTDYEGTEILMADKSESGAPTSAYFCESDGMNIKSGGSRLQFETSGAVNLVSDLSKEIKLESDGIKIGAECQEYENAVLGQKLQDLFSNVASGLTSLSSIASANPTTSIIAPAILSIANSINMALPGILSSNVKIN